MTDDFDDYDTNDLGAADLDSCFGDDEEPECPFCDFGCCACDPLVAEECDGCEACEPNDDERGE